MNIFEMRGFIIDEYSDYVRSFLPIADSRVRAFVEARLLEQPSLWPDALIQLNPAYAKGDTVAELAGAGVLHPLCGQVFAREDGRPIALYQHQQLAVERVLQKQHTVVTSGTGSGKSLTYFIPIFDAVLRSDATRPMVHAIVVYPMNALVNSQEESLRGLAEAYRGRTGRELPVRFAKYTGQETAEVKANLRQHPPHILLTNYVMLELMLVRPHEHGFVDRTRTALQFLVLDELHTYRGRQGADIALLVRRLRERCGNPGLVCIGTSATMASGGTRRERRCAIARFATRLFGVPVLEQNVVEETLRRVIAHSGTPSAGELRQALESPPPEAAWEAFASNPLAAWIEDTFGVEEEEDGHLRPRKPLSLREGARQLADLTGMDESTCIERVREMLLRASETRTPEGEPVFPFKLHQFISQGGSVFATLEPPDRRDLTLEEQIYAPGVGERLLYPLVFCRLCGQEYYTVRRSAQESRYLPVAERSLAGIDSEEDEGSQAGYLMLDHEG
ncbi:MAG: DEAD/DEAH box helicase, partial [Anaerolineae bacterium]|nr:DEAD/DEAH box helicase [Anaerolineae bacterium]